MTTVEVFAPAKINLTLHVTGQRDDGYHLLDSLVTFAFVGDRLTLAAADDFSLNVTGPFADDVPTDASNLISRAADLMGLPAAITLEKNLPVASGLGGGSADAAAAMKGLAQIHNRSLPERDAQLALGADVPVCMIGGTVRVRGIGDRLEPLSVSSTSWPMVLVNPGVAVATSDVFSRLASKDNPPMDDPFALGPAFDLMDEFFDWLAGQRNDLEAPAREIAPVIGDVLASIAAQPGCRLARMSGSGATCFGVFGDDALAAEAAMQISAEKPRWWVVLSKEPGF
ncbi:MAG: 4-(cytidine 5'-diphospho)-2-C-methyl-D-erythritol kinase [Silicimonas sp.]|nr:4-(cytidine 5'-diphospho)-2-C-methyl-D-erythritol kinase [Silicimonas sp.]